MLNFSLDIIGNEWIVIVFVAIVLFLGTKRLPEASRKFGKIWGEYSKTKNTVQTELHKVTEYNIPIQGPVENERQKLEAMAKLLGINNSNVTDDELKNMIASKIGKSSNQDTNTQTSNKLK